MTDNSTSQSISLLDVMREFKDDIKADRATLMSIASDIKVFQAEQAALRAQLEQTSDRLQEVSSVMQEHAIIDMRIAVLEADYKERQQIALNVKKKVIDVIIGRVLPFVCLAGLAALAYLQGQKQPSP